MKTLRSIIPFACAALAISTASVFAEEAKKEQPQPPTRERAARPANSLTPAEAEKLKTAMEAAKTDAAYVEAQKELVAARKKMLDALKVALVKADPEVEPILKKIGDNPQAALNARPTPGRDFQPGERGQRQGNRRSFQIGERPAPPPTKETAPVPPVEEE